MGSLITKGKDGLEVVDYLIKKFEKDNDISHIQFAGHELQQAIEFFVKDSILLLGSNYKEIHQLRPNIKCLLDLLHSNRQLSQLLVQKFEHPLLTIYEEYAIDLDDWEAGGRYDSDLDIDLDIINRILPLAEELQEAAAELDNGGSVS